MRSQRRRIVELADVRLRPEDGPGRAKTPDHMGCAEDGAPGAREKTRKDAREGPLPTSATVFAFDDMMTALPATLRGTRIGTALHGPTTLGLVCWRGDHGSAALTPG